ncbi:hypothetical protein ACNI3K_08765 [Demequina sp. SO4-13]|uniref:hypothetical protein n=1 Tax=Demequina sp. SO4-13 TaxID=3401027 RepID=UPI003AF96B8F
MIAIRKHAAVLIGAGVLTLGLTGCGDDTDAGDVVDETTAEISEGAEDIEEGVEEGADELEEETNEED